MNTCKCEGFRMGQGDDILPNKVARCCTKHIQPNTAHRLVK